MHRPIEQRQPEWRWWWEVWACARVCVCAHVCACVRDVFTIYDDNTLPRLTMIIIKIIFLYFIEIAHNDDFPSTGTRLVYMLGAICGSAISMDLLAQSMDPYSAQKSMDCADICGSLRVVACAVRGENSAGPVPESHLFKLIFLDSLHYMFGQLFPTYQSGAKRKCVIILILRQVPALSACREDGPTPTFCDFVPWIVEAH